MVCGEEAEHFSAQAGDLVGKEEEEAASAGPQSTELQRNLSGSP